MTLEETTKETWKERIVDTAGNITYSLMTGIALDAAANQNIGEIAASRTQATIINAVTGAAYSWWRDYVYRKLGVTEYHGWEAKVIADVIAFPPQLAIYASSAAVSTWLFEGEVNLEKVRDGTIYLAAISPALAPSLGFYLDKFRKTFGLKSASEKSV